MKQSYASYTLMLARIFLASRDCLISSFTSASKDSGKEWLQNKDGPSHQKQMG